VFKGHRGVVEHLYLNNDKSFIISGGSDGAVRLWDLYSKRQVLRLNLHVNCKNQHSFINELKLSNNEKFVISRGSADKTIIIFNIIEKNEEIKISSQEEFSNQIAFYRELKYFSKF
jgi:WD40 repeat protein